jgi:hypothetical protein
VAGAVQFNVTTDPLTVAEKPVGGLGAMMGAPLVEASGAGIRTGQSSAPSPWVLVALVKQAQETDALALLPAVPNPGATVIAVEGATGPRAAPPPQADIQTSAEITKITDRIRMSPPPESAGTAHPSRSRRGLVNPARQ